jgi:ribonuclease BN (tRNA processing enzyme)
MRVRLTIIGSSPAVPNPGGAHAGYLVESPSGRLLLDCGPGVLSRLRSHELLPVDAIAITHLHLDHWGDLVPWVWMTLGEDTARGRTELWLPPGADEELDTFAARFGRPGMFGEAFDLHEFIAGEPFEAAGHVLVAEPVDHFGVPAFGFRVRDNAGRVLAYSGDTAPCTGLQRIAANADLLLCEATLPSASDDADRRGHLSADEAMEVAAGAVILTHRPWHLPIPPGAMPATEGTAVDI